MRKKNHKRRRPLSEHFEGWQVGLVAVSLAGLAALVGVPRRVAPKEIPTPRIQREQFAREQQRWREAARAAWQTPLPFEVRAAGEAYRAVGRASRPGADPRMAVAEFRRIVRTALKVNGPEPLLSLRAVQLELFFRALRRWEVSGAQNMELGELGGAFADRARELGWVRRDGRLAMGTDEVAALFVVRWTELAGLTKAQPFAPTLDTWRIYYRFQILYGHGDLDPTEEALALSSTVKALGAHDPEYPTVLSRGILAFRLHRYSEAAEAFRLHLRQQPSGPWTLRARNYLAAALDPSPGGAP